MLKNLKKADFCLSSWVSDIIFDSNLCKTRKSYIYSNRNLSYSTVQIKKKTIDLWSIVNVALGFEDLVGSAQNVNKRLILLKTSLF